MSVSNALITFLEERGVRNIFGVSGAKIEGFFHEVHVTSEQISVVITKHEAVAVSAADATSKSGALMGAVAVTSGGAAFNIVPGLAEAYAQKTPLLIIVGQPMNTTRLRGGFQESSGKNGTPALIDTLSSVSRWCKRLENSSQLSQYLIEIEQILIGENSGPVVLLVPQNIFEEPVVTLPTLAGSMKPPSLFHEHYLKSFDPKGTVAIVGSEVAKQGAYETVDALLEHLQIPVVTDSAGKGSVNNRAGWYAGSIGAMGHRSAMEMVAKAKSLLVIGSPLREIDRLRLPQLEQSIISYMGKDLPFVDGVLHMGSSIEECCRFLLESVPQAREPIDCAIQTKAYEKSNLYVEVLDELNRLTTEPVNVLVDAGNGGAYAMHYLFPPRESQLHIALTMGGMGYSFGAALGAAFHNGRRTLQLTGDGSFFMHGFEIETALRLHLPISYIVFDNSGHQMCTTREQLFFNESSGNNEFLPNHMGKGFAAMYEGLPSYDVHSIEQFRAHYSRNRSKSGPQLYVIHVDDREIPPFLPFEREQ